MIVPLLDKHDCVRANTIVDSADRELVEARRWHLSSGGYARSFHHVSGRRSPKATYLHRLENCPCGQPLGHDARAYWKGNVQVWFTVPGHTVEDAAERMEWFASRVKEALNNAGIYPHNVRPDRGMGSTELSLIPELHK